MIAVREVHLPGSLTILVACSRERVRPRQRPQITSWLNSVQITGPVTLTVGLSRRRRISAATKVARALADAIDGVSVLPDADGDLAYVDDPAFLVTGHPDFPNSQYVFTLRDDTAMLVRYTNGEARAKSKVRHVTGRRTAHRFDSVEQLVDTYRQCLGSLRYLEGDDGRCRPVLFGS